MPIVEVSKILHASPDDAFRWCTDYSPSDATIAKHIRLRKIIKRKGNKVYFEDEQLDPAVPKRRTEVTLHPPSKWVGKFEGGAWQGTGTYTLSKHPEGTVLNMVFDMKRAQEDFTPDKLRARAIEIWEKYGAALESELARR